MLCVGLRGLSCFRQKAQWLRDAAESCALHQGCAGLPAFCMRYRHKLVTLLQIVSRFGSFWFVHLCGLWAVSAALCSTAFFFFFLMDKAVYYATQFPVTLAASAFNQVDVSHRFLCW